MRALENAASFVDEIVVVDDASTDDTAALCEAHPAVSHVERRTGTAFWEAGKESVAREQLWQLAAARGDWVLVFDADMLLRGITPETFRRLLLASAVNAWAWPLLDLWNDEDHYRVDGPWALGPVTPRVWLARSQPTPDFVPRWDPKAIHAGHLPHNYPVRAGLAPCGTRWLHLGWLSAAHRRKKHDQYMTRHAEMTPFERAHVASILQG